MSYQSDFFNKAESVVRAEVLWPKEEIIWAGYPGIKRTIWFKWGYCVIGIFLFILARQLIEIPTHIKDFSFISLVVALSIIWMLITPLRNYVKAARTAYFITNKRALLMQNLDPGRVRVMMPGDITDYSMTRQGKDTGDIVLKINRQMSPNLYEEDKQRMMMNMGRLARGQSIMGPSYVLPFTSYLDGFWGIQNVSAASAAINDLIKDKDVNKA
jgi:hypothetical protein